MAPTAEKLLSDALSLPEGEPAALVGTLAKSLSGATEFGLLQGRPQVAITGHLLRGAARPARAPREAVLAARRCPS